MFWDDLIDVSDPRWNETLRRLPKHDFYHLPAYLALEAERRGGIPRAYICQDDRGVFMVPFVLSPVPLVLQPTGAPPSDVLAPYGYAGPLVQFNGDERETRQFMTMALARLAEHLRHRNVCAILLRFNPMIPVPLEPFRAMGRLVRYGQTCAKPPINYGRRLAAVFAAISAVCSARVTLSNWIPPEESSTPLFPSITTRCTGSGRGRNISFPAAIF